MELHILISLLSVMHSWILCTVLAVPAGRTPPTPHTPSTASTGSPGRHVRTKRCSCATFLDKECVYFCHLDIIWVNTPERVVSYGLGSAPRTRRSVADLRAPSSSGGSGARCQCLRHGDSTCRNFCRQDEHQPGRGTVPDALIRSAGGDGCAAPQCKQQLAADTGRIKRMKSSRKRRASPLAIATKTRLLLEKWRARQRHRAREWDGESAAS